MAMLLQFVDDGDRIIGETDPAFSLVVVIDQIAPRPLLMIVGHKYSKGATSYEHGIKERRS
jgi:hypothetical protein